jgi:enoyl-CoA hydratase/carnithine racemase
MNALNRTVFEELEKVLDVIDADKSIKAVL